ncbi:MAG TPA: DNA (cytosine-5-)-methyltransferase [Limnochordia bacterium]
MRVGSLFSGIGGFDLGLERAGMEIAWQVEIDNYCRRVLAKHWPHVKRYSDIREVDPHELEPVDLVAGGPPCQPFSIAGRRTGIADERWMWPEFARVVRGVRPRWVLFENVAGLANDPVAFGAILGDLHQLGFDAEWSLVSACSMGAPHVRRRLFIVAYTRGAGLQGLHEAGRGEHLQPTAEALRRHWEAEPQVDRVAYGVPRRLVRDELRALGNAVVPQVAQWLGERILEAERDSECATT